MSGTIPIALPPNYQPPLLPRGNQGQQQFSQSLAPYVIQNNDNKKETSFKKAVVLFAPAFSLLGGLGLLAGAIVHKWPNALKPVIGKSVTKLQAEKLVKNSNRVLAGAFLFGAWNDTLSGITNKQPSMLFSGLLQFIPAGLLALNRKKIPQELIYNIWTFLAAVWTLGFANDMVHKEFSNNNEKPRQYDMTRFISAFKSSSRLSFPQRLGIIGNETGQMFAFMAKDHIQLLKSFFPKKSKPSTPTEKPPADWKGLLEPSVYVTRLSVALTYLGALPAIAWALFSKKPESAALKWSGRILRGGALALANLSFFDLAMHQKDLRGKMPLAGAPLATIGVASPSNNFLRASIQLGEGLNSLFVSDVALKGMPKNNKKSGTQPTSKETQQQPYYEHHKKAHRHPGSNTIQNGGIQA